MKQHSRTDLCGGRPETAVPTATGWKLDRSFNHPPRKLTYARFRPSQGEGEVWQAPFAFLGRPIQWSVTPSLVPACAAFISY